MSERVVLDSSAILAIVFGEPGEDRALELVAHALVSTVNLSEAVAKMNERGFERAVTRVLLRGLGFRVETFDERGAYEAGELRQATRGAGLSFGDRACLSLALREELPVATADRAWQAVELGVEIEMIR
ncbi:MAG TPA: type II toxin-antitoxin system VapC family toxin [Paracoccaceae bacterium]|nr:type II toxin-antitoxin system VapC family toxin [Paracoccaceae bacterium]